MNLEQEILNELVSIKTLILKQNKPETKLGWDFDHTEKTISALEKLEQQGPSLVPFEMDRILELQKIERKHILAKSEIKETLDFMGYPDVPTNEHERKLYTKLLILWEALTE